MDFWFFPENNKIQELGEGGIQVEHRVPGDPGAQVWGTSCKGCMLDPFRRHPRPRLF